MVAVVLAVIPVMFSVIRRANKRYAWIIITAAVLIGILFVFDFGFPRNWYPESGDNSSFTEADEQAPLGEIVFALSKSEESPSSRISQLIPDD